MLYYVTKFLNLLTDNCIYYRRYLQKISNGSYFLNQFEISPLTLFWLRFCWGKNQTRNKNRKQEATAFRELRCEESKLQSRLKFYDVQKYSCCFLLSFKNTFIDICWYSPWVGNQKINWSIWSTNSGSKSLQWCQHISTTS